MIIDIIGGRRPMQAFYPKDEMGCNLESAILISRDADDAVVIYQENDSICVSAAAFPELIKALQRHLKASES